MSQIPNPFTPSVENSNIPTPDPALMQVPPIDGMGFAQNQMVMGATTFTPEQFNNIQQPQLMGSVINNNPTVVAPINQQLTSQAITLNQTKQKHTKEKVQQSEPEIANAPVINTPPPTLEEGQSIIAQLTPGAFDSFIKVLSLLDEKNIINITNSNILQLINNNSAILSTNIQQLVGNNPINLHILQPKVNIRLFKAIKDNNDVFIIDDTINKRFYVVSGEVRIWLPKQIEDIQPEVVAPSFSVDQCIGNPITISKEERTKISTLISGATSVTLLLKDNQLQGYLVPEKVEATFKQFTGTKITEKTATLKLMSSAFLSIPSDGDTIITLAKQNENYWMMSKINTAMVEIIIIESLQVAQNDELLL